MSRSWRLIALGLCVAVLLAAALAPHDHRSGTPALPRVRTSQTIPAPRRSTAPPALRRSACRFLGAFLDFEVGVRSPAIRRSLRVTTTPEFGAELLADPSASGPKHPSRPPRLEQLTIRTLGPRGSLASISAVAHRPSGPEQLSFLFARRQGRWLASAPGE